MPSFPRSAAAAILLSGMSVLALAETFVPAGLSTYQQTAKAAPDAQRGKAFWNAQHKDEQGRAVSCATCHGDDLSKPGKHYKSGKVIEPMSHRANPERLTDAEKVEKWFKRNCKQVMGRECTALEKSDVLSFLAQS